VTNDRGKSDTRIDPAACTSVLRAKKHGLEFHRVFDRSAIEDVREFTLSSEGSSNGVDVAKVTCPCAVCPDSQCAPQNTTCPISK
jgi:hypothetical protein